MMDRDNLYYAELAAADAPPSFRKEGWKGLDEASDDLSNLVASTIMRKNVNSNGIEIRLWSYNKRQGRITLINVEKGEK